MMNNDFKRAFVVEALNVHPVIIFGIIILEVLIFASEVVSGGLSFFLCCLCAILFGNFTVYVQTNVSVDSLHLAISKGILVCLILVVPTPILTMMFLGLYFSKKQR